MSLPPVDVLTAETEPQSSVYVRVTGLLLLVFAFLLGVHGFGDGFRLLGSGVLDSFFRATENPFVGLMAGVLATSIVQSSSVTTSLVVGLVAAPENALPLANAIPMVMGANFGTTITNTAVSLGHLGRRDEFRRAFAVSTCDDFFEILSVSIILPLEWSTGFLQHSATFAASLLVGFGGAEYHSPLGALLDFGLEPLQALLAACLPAESWRALGLILVSGALVFGALLNIVRAMREWTGTAVQRAVSNALGKSAARGFGIGVATTAVVQSSSITTSLLVPLAGAGVLSLEQAFPIVLGANVGTTFTALMAALAASGPNAKAGLTIAIVHALYNLTGTAIFLPFRVMRQLPLGCARWLAKRAAASPPQAFAYVAAIFYGLPASVAGIVALLGW